MSTRSVIARKTPEGFAGVYHHWDGYPSALGAHLFQHLAPQSFTLKRQLKRLIDDHPGGWVSIMGIVAEPFGDEHATDPLTHENTGECGCEYAYVVNEETAELEIWSSVSQNGQKMIGMFGSGDPDATWKQIGAVKLGAEKAPDWEAMQ